MDRQSQELEQHCADRAVGDGPATCCVDRNSRRLEDFAYQLSVPVGRTVNDDRDLVGWNTRVEVTPHDTRGEADLTHVAGRLEKGRGNETVVIPSRQAVVIPSRQAVVIPSRQARDRDPPGRGLSVGTSAIPRFARDEQ